MTRPEVEEFISLVSNPDSPWGMADHDALELCNYILHLESEVKRKDAALRAIRKYVAADGVDLAKKLLAIDHRALSALTPARETGET